MKTQKMVSLDMTRPSYKLIEEWTERRANFSLIIQHLIETYGEDLDVSVFPRYKNGTVFSREEVKENKAKAESYVDDLEDLLGRRLDSL